MTGTTPDRCASCGLVVAGGQAGCQALMDDMLARDFSDVQYFRAHRLLVDTYCLQHPDKYCVSFKSFAAHLLGVCWSMEFGGGHAVPLEALRRWVERHPQMTKPDIPDVRGALTIGDVVQAADPVEHARLVQAWATSTWTAYSSLHAVARHWYELAVGGQRNAGGGRKRTITNDQKIRK